VGAVTDAGIIDQNTQPAMGRNCEVDHRGDFALVRDIDLERLTADFVRGPLGPFAIPIGDDHQRALRGQTFARLQTLAGCAAGAIFSLNRMFSSPSKMSVEVGRDKIF
jgi:hypothetical protein